nr:hypothetical protein [Clostridium botulinum]
MYNYCNLEKKILCIARNEYSFFLNKNNVIGLGLGQKIKMDLILFNHVLLYL